MDSPDVLTIRCGHRVAQVVPELGAALAAFYDEHAGGHRHWLRPATAQALAARDPLRMASFVLLPWCNRIRDGRFAWEGSTVQLAASGPQPHALHGVGWRVPWQVEALQPDRIELRLDWAASAQWPFAFRARQRYELTRRALEVTVELTNTGTSPMPAGIGHHPYFAQDTGGPGARLRAEVEAIWESDGELLPTRLVRGSHTVEALRAGMRVAAHALDNNFTGFGHLATIDWPDGRALRMTAATPLDHFVVYSPAGADHFCAEAVINCTDWPNLKASDPAAPVGGRRLTPGETLAATTCFEPVAADESG